MKDYLGKVSLTLEEIRKLSNTDQSYWFALRGTKSGSIELRVKVLSEECEVCIITNIIGKCIIINNNMYHFYPKTQSTYATSTISEASTRPSELQDPPVINTSNIIRRPSMEKSRMRLHLEPVVPPPPPPRTVTLVKPPIAPLSNSAQSSPIHKIKNSNHTSGKLLNKILS